MENLLTFIPENLLILIAAIYVFGIFLKKLESVKDNYITLILMLLAITFAVLLNIFNSQYKVLYEAIINAILQGILCWGVAVGINQTGKQISRAKKEQE
ncbi:MAG: phage holin family protein [Clostridium sp.]|uniref:phage holin family protein n=1 Tax=Clostridium sp. TaxID=1506 RepID=UPI00290A3F08|nr:phage holin family protein [Clostridium sp.]MDU5111398.1 phage holin family protein [Clostridium sp.]